MRFGAKPILLVGQVLIVAGLVLFAISPVQSSYLGDLLAPMLLLGVGAGLSFPSLMGLAMSSATQQDSGLASGLVNTSLQVGGALGLAVLATLSSHPHRQPAGERHLARRSPDQRFPPRLLDRRRPGHRGGRDHDAGPSLRAGDRRGRGPRSELELEGEPASGKRPNPAFLDRRPRALSSSSSSRWRSCLLARLGRPRARPVAARSP